jgi:TRAP-type C4-dicarboxylate transport system permease large subunit
MVVILFAVVLGGIYGGLFTATEAGGIGAVGGLVVALLRRTSASQLFEIFKDTVQMSAMLFALIVGAGIFSELINLTGADKAVLSFLNEIGVSATVTITAIIIIYILLGAVMDELSMILLTLPIFFPIVIGLGYDPVWFGILVVMMVELGLIVPPMALNLFIVRGIAPDVPLGVIFRGIIPFVVVDVLRVALMVAAPIIVLWLPNQLFGA